MNSLSSNIQQQVQTLQGLEGKIREIVLYLKDVREGKLPPNNKIMFLLQVILKINHSKLSIFYQTLTLKN